MEVTEAYQSTTTLGEISTEASGETTTEFSITSEKVLGEGSKSFEFLRFSTVDYTVFAMMLAMSALIGIYFGFISKTKQNNSKEYLLGGKSMNFFPIATSLIASHISGITLISIPAEMYANGTQYMIMFIPAVVVGIALLYIYLPVFYELQLTSSFEYLEMRFDKTVRRVASFMYAIYIIIFVPVVVYVPALAFSQVSGINLHVIAFVTSLICVFYTTVGGLKAVVWTDTLQFLLMIGSIACVIFLGLQETRGFLNVWEAAERGKRLVFFNMDPSPFVRTSFWTVSLGLTSLWISNLGVSQTCIQRFLAVPDINFARKSVWIFVFGMIFINAACGLVGLIIFAKYETCDPVLTNQIQKVDQILPFFVMKVAKKIPGLPGIFIAGIFSAALSSMSTGLNTLAGTIYEDFLRHRFPNVSEKRVSDVMKLIVIVLGMLILSLVFVVEQMGQILRISVSVSGLTAGALLGLFTVGMLSRFVNTKGVICGAIGSMTIVSVIMVGAQFNPKDPPLPTRTDGCDFAFNVTSPVLPEQLEEVPMIFKLSFMYYTLLGTVLLIGIAYIVSFFTGGCKSFDERLLAPFIRKENSKCEEVPDTKKDVMKTEVIALERLSSPDRRL